MIPGTKQLRVPTVWFLVDTSGSIIRPWLIQFLSEVYAALKHLGGGFIIAWDAQAYSEIELKKAEDLNRLAGKGALRGGGGTTIAPALEKVIELMAKDDLVVVMTDGEIFDITALKTQELLARVAVKSSTAIFGTMKMDVVVPVRWRKIKIESDQTAY